MAQPFRYADAAARAEYILGRLRGQKTLDAVRSVSGNDTRASQIADDLLRHPDALKRVDEFLGDHGMELGKHVGAGAESIVWEALPRTGEPPQVLKIRPEAESVGAFDHPHNVPGVVPYWASAQVGPNIAAALQQQADVAFRPKRGLELPFSQAATRVGESLLARGWHWGDGHKWNIGVMPDRTWGIIDGFIDRAHPSWTLPKYSDEEAIRMLRLTPRESEMIYGQ